MAKVKQELSRMEELGVISPISEPTNWCAGMVVVPKANNQVRICVDMTKLNENVLRERQVLPSVEQTLGQLGGAKHFSKLDANSGFWQIPLDYESSLLTTFITPFGRYRFNRLPFGITSAPEHFQHRMSAILSGLGGVVCHMDDILVYGESKKAHDSNLRNVLERLQKAGLTLNKGKCKFFQQRVQFLGQVIDGSGVSPDPEKIKAIQDFSEPKDVPELRRFLGIVNQLSKFTKSLADMTKPLRDLLSKQNLWYWGPAQATAFQKIKEALSSIPMLALFDPNRPTRLSADASSYGLGATLSQQQPSGEYRPVAYISRALSPTEQRYAQIEKEALALTWGCERLSDYLIGLHFHMVTDHKPLVPILSTKNLDDLPVRVQRFRLRLMRYHFTISHVPGKDLVIADALSRAPSSLQEPDDIELQQDTEAFVDQVIRGSASGHKLALICQKQTEDKICRQLKEFCKNGWPTRSTCPGELKPYLSLSSEFSVKDNLLMRGRRIVIPLEMQQDILRRIHEGHQGITKCRLRARESVWWLNLSKQIAELIQRCPVCCKERVQGLEPLLPSQLPNHPWSKVGMDLFQWKGAMYLLIIDYFSRYIEIAKLGKESSEEVIRHTKSIFARHGIPEIVISDNGPQFTSSLFQQFAKEYEFEHHTSSPYHPQGNGEAERAVKTIKSLLKKATDPYLALLTYRSTPLASLGFSPAELLMSRQLRTTIPIYPKHLQPSIPKFSILAKRDQQQKERQKRDFDSKHQARPLKPLQPDDPVWVTDKQKPARIVGRAGKRSYHLQAQDGASLRRNRHHLIFMPESATDAKHREDKEEDIDDDLILTDPAIEHESSGEQTPSDPSDLTNPRDPGEQPVGLRRSGRISRPPIRYDPNGT